MAATAHKRAPATKSSRSVSAVQPAAETTGDDVPTLTTPPPREPDGPVLFRANDVEYRMHADRSFAAGLRYLRAVQRQGGGRFGQLAIIEHVAGPGALDALLATEPDEATWTRIVQRASDHVLGRLEEEPPGN